MNQGNPGSTRTENIIENAARTRVPRRLGGRYSPHPPIIFAKPQQAIVNSNVWIEYLFDLCGFVSACQWLERVEKDVLNHSMVTVNDPILGMDSLRFLFILLSQLVFEYEAFESKDSVLVHPVLSFLRQSVIARTTCFIWQSDKSYVVSLLKDLTLSLNTHHIRISWHHLYWFSQPRDAALWLFEPIGTSTVALKTT